MYMDTCTEPGVTFAPPPQVIRETDEDINGVIPRTDLERDVLAFCNHVRWRLRRDPVDRLQKGMCSDSGHCVVANTIGGVQASYFNVNELDHGRRNVIIDVPSPVMGFMIAFDKQKYPRLIKGYTK